MKISPAKTKETSVGTVAPSKSKAPESFIDLSHKDIPVAVLKEIPEEAAAFYGFVPISREGNVLEAGMVDQGDLKAKEALRFITQQNNLKVKLRQIDKKGLDNVLRQYRTLRGEVKKALRELESSELATKPVRAKKKKVIKRKVAAEAPITKIVSVILRHAVEGRASDIHIEPGETEAKVRFRVDGALYTSLVVPKAICPAIVARIKVLTNLKIDETRKPQDGRFRTTIIGKKIDFRVSTFPTALGEKVVLRVLDPAGGLDKFEDLGIGEHHMKILTGAIDRPFGMVLMTGPTGSGKTTTLYAILKKLNEETVNIVSLEDPVEYFVEGISQSQIRPEIDYTFATGLRHILRQDPDVIMVGEIRDEETAGLAIHAALTGHILLSTLHTNNAIGVIPRLIDMGISRLLLPSALTLAAAQRLARRLCPKCREEIDAPPEVTRIIKEEFNNLPEAQKKKFAWKEPFKIFRSKGCKFCGNKGSKGRIALYEMFAMTPELEKVLASEGMGEAQLKEEARRQGMVTMKQDGIFKVLQGVISFEEMIRKVEEKMIYYSGVDNLKKEDEENTNY